MDHMKDPVRAIDDGGTGTGFNPSSHIIVASRHSFKNGGGTSNKDPENSDSSSVIGPSLFLGGSNTTDGRNNYALFACTNNDDKNTTSNNNTSYGNGIEQHTTAKSSRDKRSAQDANETENNNRNTPTGGKPKKSRLFSVDGGSSTTISSNLLFPTSVIDTDTSPAPAPTPAPAPADSSRDTVVGGVISSTNQKVDSNSSSKLLPIPLCEALEVARNNGYNENHPYFKSVKIWEANIHSRVYPDPLPPNVKVELYQCRPCNVNPNGLSINSYYLFSIRDESTDEWIPILSSRSAPNAANRFKEIDFVTCGETIRKAAGETVAGTTYTTHLLKGVIRVERVDENILVSELGWVSNNADWAKVLLEKAGAKKKAADFARLKKAAEELVAAENAKKRVELASLRLKDPTPLNIAHINMLAAILRNADNNEVAQFTQLWQKEKKLAALAEKAKEKVAAAKARMAEERAAKAEQTKKKDANFARLKKAAEALVVAEKAAEEERAAKSAALFREDKKLAWESLNICIPPGSLGVGIDNTNGYCTVSSKTNQHSPLEVFDIITSLNGINLVECEGGINAWVTLFGAATFKFLVVQRCVNTKR